MVALLGYHCFPSMCSPSLCYSRFSARVLLCGLNKGEGNKGNRQETDLDIHISSPGSRLKVTVMHLMGVIENVRRWGTGYQMLEHVSAQTISQLPLTWNLTNDLCGLELQTYVRDTVLWSFQLITVMSVSVLSSPQHKLTNTDTQRKRTLPWEAHLMAVSFQWSSRDENNINNRGSEQ